MNIWRVVVLLFLTMLAVPGAVVPAGAETGKRVMLILDASGSMWGQIDGKAKIVTAKEVMSDLIKDLPSSLEVGLTVYGHRFEGDCNDVEEMLPLAPLDRDQLISRIRAIKPRGKTPLAHSISLVAEKQKAMGGGGTIILVSDGEETCGGDPCKLVADLKAAGVEFVMHVVGFDVKGPVSEQLACIAKAGGGTYAEARDAAKLKTALTSVIQETLAENLVVRAVKSSPNKKEKPAALDAVVTVFKDGARAAESSGSRVGFKLEPGTYDLNVAIPALGQSKKLEKISVSAATKTEKEAAFTVSALGAVARDSNGKPIEVYLKISARGSETPAAEGWTGTETPRLFALPAGTYTMELSEKASGQQAVIENVVLADGQELIKEVSFSVAKLAVTAKDSQGKPMDVHFDVFKQGDSENRVADGWTGTDELRYLDLPPGSYDLKVRDNKSNQQTAIKDVALEPGAKVLKEVSFSVAKLAVTAKDSQGKPMDIHFDVFKQGDTDNRVADSWTGTGEPKYLALPPGVYDLKIEDKKSNQQTAIKDVALEPGAKVVKEVSFSVAKLAVTAKDSQGKPMDVHFDVFKQGDPEKRVADSWTGTGEPKYLALPPGVYDLKVEDKKSNKKTVLKDVTLQPGDKVVKEVSF